MPIFKVNTGKLKKLSAIPLDKEKIFSNSWKPT